MIVKAKERSGASTELELSPANLGGIFYVTLHNRDSPAEGGEEPSGSQLVHVPGGIVAIH